MSARPQFHNILLRLCHPAQTRHERVSSLGLIFNLIQVLVPQNALSSSVMLLVSGGRLAAPELRERRFIYVPALLFGWGEETPHR